MFNFLKKLDIISANSSTRIHFGNEANYKTVTGGICSMLAISTFLIIACVQGYNMFQPESAIINELKHPWRYKNKDTDEIEKVNFKDGYTIVLHLLENKKKHFLIDKSKLHIYAKRKERTYTKVGEETVENISY